MCGRKSILALRTSIIRLPENLKYSTKSPQVITMSFKTYKNQAKRQEPPAPTLLMMHGLFGSKDNWRSVCKAFHRNTKPQRKVIAVDARNHGDSPHASTHTYPHLAEDIGALLAHQQINKAALLGHSMGGRAMMYFSLKNPGLVDRLIVGDISPVSASETFQSMASLFEALKKVILPKNVSKTAAKLDVEQQLLQIIEDPSLSAFLVTNLTQEASGRWKWKPNIPVLAASFNDHLLKFPDVTNEKFAGPVLFVTGKNSDFVPKADYGPILKLFPSAQFKEIDGAGHWLYTDRPNEFIKICSEFLNRKS